MDEGNIYYVAFWCYKLIENTESSWACNQLKPSAGQRITRYLNELCTWACDTVMWHWSVDTLFWQLPIDHNMDVHYQVKHR